MRGSPVCPRLKMAADRRHPTHMCVFEVDTVNGLDKDAESEFTEITWIGYTIVDFKERDITISEDFEIELSTVKGSDGLEYRYITPETLKEVTDLVAASIRDLGQDANCSLICEGALHLRHYLHRRARQKDIELDPAYYTYFDLHTEFHKTFPRTPGDSLEEMARSLNMTLPDHKLERMERHKIFAAVLLCLVRMGHIFADPLVIQHRWDYDPRLLPAPKTIQNCMVVGVTGMDYNLQYSDLLDFFAGLNVHPGGIVLCINKNGQKNGQATVVFEDEEQVAMAMMRHEHHLKNHGRYLQLKRTTKNELLQQIYGNSRPLTSSPAIRRCVCRFKYLPPDTTKEDLVRWVRPECRVAGGTDGVFLLQCRKGKQLNEAMAVFSSFDDMYGLLGRKCAELKGQKVLAQPMLMTEFVMMVRKTIAHRQDMYPFLREALQSALDRVLVRFSLVDDRVVLWMKGLPTHYTPKDILQQYEHLAEEIVKGGIRPVLDTKGRFTGECYVQMRTSMLAYLACQRLRNGKKRFDVERHSNADI